MADNYDDPADSTPEPLDMARIMRARELTGPPPNIMEDDASRDHLACWWLEWLAGRLRHVSVGCDKDAVAPSHHWFVFVADLAKYLYRILGEGDTLIEALAEAILALDRQAGEVPGKANPT